MHHEACPNCPSSDAFAIYDDGHGHCFSCGHHTPAVGDKPQQTGTNAMNFKTDLEYTALPNRRISEETCRKFSYGVSSLFGKPCQIATYRHTDGRTAAQKIRFANKEFQMHTDGGKTPLFGQHLWRDGGKRLVVVEGEIDAMSACQALSRKLSWPVVSVPSGAQGAAKAIADNLEFVEAFDAVVFAFDADEPGQEAVQQCVSMLKPGKAKVALLPLKDASEMLQQGREAELKQALWDAQTFRPDGIRELDEELIEQVCAETAQGDSWPWKWLTEQTYGRRLGEVYALGAGTGIGKTDVFTQIIAHVTHDLKKPAACFFLEQQPAETVKRIAGKIAGVRFHLPDGSWTREQLTDVVTDMQSEGTLHLYDNFGATDWDAIKAAIKSLAFADGVQDFFLDHLTALASTEDDERKALAKIMTELAMLAQECRVRIHFISHLATPEGKPHEEGGRVMVRHFKGARDIGFWSHYMIGLERNQQAEDEVERRTTTLRILKDRYTGQATGKTMRLVYDLDDGRLHDDAACIEFETLKPHEDF